MTKLDGIKAVIFDLDGTLIDTEKIYREVWPKAVAKLGYEMKDEYYLAMRSLGRPFAPLKMKEWFGDEFDYDEARRIRKGYFDAYVAKHPIEVKKGAFELLDYLRGKGIVTAIATATDIPRATAFLKEVKLDGYFDRVISAADVKEGKPSPYVYELACEKLGFTPKECVAVEDAPNGVTSAYRAGLNVIMVPDATMPDEKISDMLVACVESLDRIIEIV